MEGILYQRVSPLLKCVVLFLFIFTAKVLTTRPQESQDGKNSIHHLKPNHFVRTFTKYHHRRTIQWNQENWPSDDQPKVTQKRSADVPFSNWDKQSRRIVKRNANSNEFIHSEFLRDNIESAISVNDNRVKNSLSSDKNSLSNNVQKIQFKVKPAFIPTSPPTVPHEPTIRCLFKLNQDTFSSSPPFEVNKKEEMDENEVFEIGQVSRETLPNGETWPVEQCTDPKSYCYILWQQDSNGNSTVVKQGCWHGSCGNCIRSSRPPGTQFCCCTTALCNTPDVTVVIDESVPARAESSLAGAGAGAGRAGYSGAALSSLLALVLLLATAAALHRIYCRKPPPDAEGEKEEVMGSGPDALATGLLCVDNLTLIEHIGQGKFGSVWRGSLGSTAVAVKLYSNPAAWQKEAAIYALPHLQHPNILRYYGSDARATLDGGREHLLVLELCAGTLRTRLQAAPVSWPEFARLAHGLASALAHLHTPVGNKPCVVHRDVNSNNVLVVNGNARLADLGLAQALPARAATQQPSRIAEAGTLRYLAPEALEGALDLTEARAALCAVDVYALGLVLWELVWRCGGAHAGPAPPYALPYQHHGVPDKPTLAQMQVRQKMSLFQQLGTLRGMNLPYQHHGVPDKPTLAQMQSVVSRAKARPPSPPGGLGGAGGRALRVALDTCHECWDHDAEARLTAVCVEERMCELKQSLRAAAPLLHDNNLHPPDSGAAPDNDKNSNVTSAQVCDVTLLPPPPHTGRNACIQRNTHTHTPTTHTLVHRSLKDVTEPAPVSVPENCLSVARIDRTRPLLMHYENSGLNEIRSYQRPIEFVPNDVSAHDERKGPKETNLLQDVKVEKQKWGIRKFFEKKLGKSKLETEVKLVPEHSGSGSVQNGRIKTTIVNGRSDRPSNLVLDQERNYNFEIPCTLSPPNRTLSPTMLMESDLNRENRVFGFKELPTSDENKTPNQIFAVIVPKAKPTDYLIEMQNARGSSDSMKNSVRTSMSSQSFIKSGHSESEDSTVKKRLSCDNKILNSGRSSRASINLELQYMENNQENFQNDSPYDLNSDCSSSEDEQLMLLSENGGSKITMQAIPKPDEKKKYQNEVLKETSHKTELGFNFQNRYQNFDNEFSDPNDKENLVAVYSGDNPVYLAALNGEINTTDLKILTENENPPKPSVKSLVIKRQHSLEQVSEIFASSGDVSLLNPAGRVKTPGDLPAAVRRARRDRALQKGRANECNRLSLYDDRMMFGNSL